MRVLAGTGSAVIAATLAVGTLLVTAPAVHSAPDRYALGDSVMLGAKPNLKDVGFGVVDATVSRQAYSGPATLRKRGDRLPQNVVVHLGTNGTFPLDVCRAMVRAVGPDRRLFLVTVHANRSWTKGNNKVIRACDEAFAADRVYVVDWDWAATRHPSWLYSDGFHLRPAGARAYARIIDTAIDTAIAAEQAATVASTSGRPMASGLLVGLLVGLHGSVLVHI